MSDWISRLWDFGEMYQEMEASIRNYLKKCTYAELQQLGADVQWPENHNCWWAVYRAAPVAKVMIGEEIAYRNARFSDERHQVCALRWGDD